MGNRASRKSNEYYQLARKRLCAIMLVYVTSAAVAQPAEGMTTHDRFQARAAEGKKLLQQDPEAAIKSFRLALELTKLARLPRSTTIDVTLGLARAYDSTRDTPNALHFYRKALLLTQDQVDGKSASECRKAIMRLGAETNALHASTQILNDCLQNLIDAQPQYMSFSSPSTHAAATDTLALFKEYNLNAALIQLGKKMREGVAQEPLARSEEPVYLNILANNFYHQGDYESALRYYNLLLMRFGWNRTASSSIPASDEIKSRIKEILVKQNRFDEADLFDSPDEKVAFSSNRDFENLEFCRKQSFAKLAPLFHETEFSGPVSVHFTDVKPIFAASENRLFIEVKGAKHYKTVWNLVKNDGSVISKDKAFGSLRPGVEWRSKGAIVGDPDELNSCTYIAPDSSPPGEFSARIQILNKSNDRVVAERTIPISVQEPIIKLVKPEGQVDFGKPMQVIAAVKNLAPGLDLRWQGAKLEFNEKSRNYRQDGSASFSCEVTPNQTGILSVSAEIFEPELKRVIKACTAKIEVRDAAATDDANDRDGAN
ncbi:tetratricopeptide repeat protein [Candidatus Obscuribacterales bacterium]|nr:tetratricopeptide repeat protein [Candidatus Obscuribacterales bacterium]